MAQGKDLKFQFVLDDQSFARVKRAIGELTTEAQKFAKAMQGGGLFGGANVGKPPSAVQTQGRVGGPFGSSKSSLGQAILGDVDAFNKLAKSGTQGMAAMTDAVRRGIREQMQEIDKLNSKMAQLHSRFQKDPRAAYEGAFRTNLQTQMLTRQGQLAGANSNLAQLQSLQSGLTPGAGGGAGGMLSPTGPAASLASIAKAGGVIVGSIVAGVNESMAGTRSYSTAEASRSQLINSEIRRLRTGDVTGMMALRTMMRDPDRAKDFRDQGGTGAKFEAGFAGVGGAMRNVASRATFGLIPGAGGGGDQAILDPLSDASRNTGMMQNAMQQAREFENSTAFLNKKIALENFYSNFATRKSVGRILGTGLSVDPKTGRPMDSFGNLDSKMTEAGYDASSYASSVAQARGMAGNKFAGKNAFAIMAANAAGYGGYGDMIAGAARSGRPDAGRMALGGGIDLTAGIELGRGVIGSGFDVRGTTGGLGLLGAAQGGMGFTGGTGDFNLVQQALAGMGLGGKVTGGGLDAYQSGRNIINAVSANPSGTTYAQDYLGNGMSLKQLMDAATGDMTQTGKSLGLTAGMARKQLSGSMTSLLDRFVDQGGSDPMSKAIRSFRQSGVGIEDYLRGNKGAAGDIGSFFGLMSGEGEEAGIGLAKLLGGFGTKGKMRGGPAGGRGDIEKLVDEQQAKSKSQDARELETMFQDMAASLKLAPEALKVFGEGGENLGKAADQFIKSLGNLATSMDEASYVIKRATGIGGVPFSAKPPGYQAGGVESGGLKGPK